MVFLIIVIGINVGLVGAEEIPQENLASCEQARYQLNQQDQGRSFRICITRTNP